MLRKLRLTKTTDAEAKVDAKGKIHDIGSSGHFGHCAEKTAELEAQIVKIAGDANIEQATKFRAESTCGCGPV